MNTELYIFYHHLAPQDLQAALEDVLTQVPDYLHDRALRYQDKLSALNFLQGRLLLSHGAKHLNLNVDLSALDYFENGKPSAHGIEFNISHSQEWAVCAFSSHGTVGIDIEQPSSKHMPHLKQNFTEQEWGDIHADPKFPNLFYRLWCRKESVIKASGRTLHDLHRLDLNSLSDQFVLAQEEWHLRDLSFADDIFAAVCTRYAPGTVHILPCDFEFRAAF